MKILWFTWKDKKHPLAGGAEMVNEELAKRLVKDGHEVILIVGGFKGGINEEIIDGYKVIRLGNRWSVYWKAYRYFKNNLTGFADIVIEEVNTIPFFTKFYAKCSKKNFLVIHQLCRKVWFYQMFFPLNIVGYLIEPIYIRLLSDQKVVTISESSKDDLLRFGFKKDSVSIIPLGIDIEPVASLDEVIKFDKPTIISLGAIRGMKRTMHILKAFEILKEEMSEVQLIVAGSANGKYGASFIEKVEKSKYASSIQYLGSVTKDKKKELMQKSHVIAVTSAKEGWGLIVTEANSQGTPAVVYNVDGLRDAVKDIVTGLITEINNEEALAETLKKALTDKNLYTSLQKNAWEWSKTLTNDESYRIFKENFNE